MSGKTGCIIVPYRDRAEHLEKFIPHYRELVPDLPIILVEQADDKPFNRAKLLNIGFLEVGHKFDYCIFHDVDMLAVSSDAYLIYPKRPLHLATACSQFGYKLPYKEYFGGVTSISTKDMLVLNGFSNDFWGYGGEDDMMYRHCVNTFGDIFSFEDNVYECFDHDRHINAELHKRNVNNLERGKQPYDGLSSCVYDKVGIYHNRMNDNPKHNLTQIVVKL